MRTTKAFVAVLVIGMAASAGLADVFYVTRDNGINCSDAYDNQGALSAVRTAKWGLDETCIMDFDSDAIKTFIGTDPILDYTFTLYIMPSAGWPTNEVYVDVQTINTNDDWAEGDDTQRFNSFGWTEGTPAATGEYAQTYHIGGALDPNNCVAWTRENGTPESLFKYLPANFTNSVSLAGRAADHGSYISVVLDGNLVDDLLSNPKNRGLRLYRNAGDNLENYTREAAANQCPYLEVVYSGGVEPEIAFAGPSTDGSESATPGKLRVQLSESTSLTVTVDYQATGGTAMGGGVDYTLASDTLTFNPGETVKYIEVAIVNDGDEESDETIVVTLSNPVNGTLGSLTGHTYTILDQDRTGQTWNCSTLPQMEYAWRNCEPNDEIVLAAGTYVLEAIPTISAHHVTMRGATGNPDDVILTGPGMNVDQNPRTGIVIGADNVTIRDLTVEEVYWNGIHIKGESDVDRVWLTNIKTFNCGERHLKGSRNFEDVASDSEDTLVEFVVMAADKVPTGHPDNNYVGGIDFMAMKDLIIRDCVAINIKGGTGGGRGGIFLWQENYNPTVERNVIYGGDSGICLGNPGFTEAGHCVVGGIVRNNFVTRGAYVALEFCFTKDVKVYNNSIYSEDASYFRTVHIYGSSTTNLQSKYNIIRGQVYENGASWTDQGSIIGTTPQADWFVNPAVADLHLTANAGLAIDAASPLSEVPEDFDEQPRGTSPDVGADESNPPGVPTVTIQASDPDAAEELQDTGTFTVSRDDTNGDLVVYCSVGGTAGSGDYEETLSGKVTILDGDPSTTITITPVDDGEFEGYETVVLTLTAHPTYNTGSPSSDTVTIADNDTGPEQLFFDDFESGNLTAGGWATTGAASASRRAAYSGSYGLELGAVASATKALSTVGYSDIRVKCYWMTSGLDSGEYLYGEWSDDGGQMWYELGRTQVGSWTQADFPCPAGAADNADFQFRFRTDANKTNERGLVDNVEVIGTSQ
ncbi:MAG TPA: Calx-beta domain-containing protein [Phycisphaerae bacterium]|nr:Calx-beta domain-containing protein [Phycisphaerae bacterium]